jgi:hemoglobin
MEPRDFYRAIGGAAGCHALATQFYAHVERDPILRPLFPSTFTCAIEELSAFLVQFLGGEAEATQRRWWLSLSESHRRFPIGEKERTAWLEAMNRTLANEALISNPEVREDLMEFFRQSSAHVANLGKTPAVQPATGTLAGLWEEQLALDEAVALTHQPNGGERGIELARGSLLQARFARSPSVHASFLALAARSRAKLLREYAFEQVRAKPSLVLEHYSHGRTLLYDACATGDLALVEFLLDLGQAAKADADKALYGVGNECSSPSGNQIVRLLMRRTSAQINAAHGVKRCTALHMAARRGNSSVIEALLDEGADIEAPDSVGDTPLRRAVNCNQLDAARCLLARGADPDSIGSKALTPRRAARSRPMQELLSTISGA